MRAERRAGHPTEVVGGSVVTTNKEAARVGQRHLADGIAEDARHLRHRLLGGAVEAQLERIHAGALAELAGEFADLRQLARQRNAHVRVAPEAAAAAEAADRGSGGPGQRLLQPDGDVAGRQAGTGGGCRTATGGLSGLLQPIPELTAASRTGRRRGDQQRQRKQAEANTVAHAELAPADDPGSVRAPPAYSTNG